MKILSDEEIVRLSCNAFNVEASAETIRPELFDFARAIEAEVVRKLTHDELTIAQFSLYEQEKAVG